MFFQKNPRWDETEEYICTLNSMGYMTLTLDDTQNSFIDWALKNPDECYLDIGCAFGNTTLPLIKEKISVTSCDINIEHLQYIQKQLTYEYLPFLGCLCGAFPQDIFLPENYFNGVIMAMVLHFMEAEYVQRALNSIYRSLKPSGKLFLTTSSPYQGVLKTFIPIYESRKEKGDLFAGFMANVGDYVPHRQQDLPPRNIVYDYESLETLCRRSGFEVETSGFFTRPHMPKDLCLDGREYSFIIVRKP